MLDKKKKLKLVEKYRTHKNDTGSTEVQVAILTEEIKELTNHLKTHKKDFSSRRGLLAKVALRHKLMRYLEREDEKRFTKLVKALKLKMPKRQQVNMAEYLEKEEVTEEEEEEIEE
ncbi:30S ribosomal protein S15 [Candidatus Nomurabacteria bacterium]|nr:30S ribosomal protein S15 [Candidatus Nomurabacteria bacterium]